MPFLMDSGVEFKTTSKTAGGSDTKEMLEAGARCLDMY